MKTRPIHQNLDTSFVNLSALVKYLRRRQFIGCVKIQLNGYKAEIVLKKDNRLSVQERDEISGRVSEGEEAFQRLLIRAREPGGSVNVFQLIKETKQSQEKPERKVAVKTEVQAVEVKSVNEPMIQAEFVRTPIPKPAKAYTPQPEYSGTSNGKTNGRIEIDDNLKIAKKERGVNGDVPKFKAKPSLPDFPFELANRFERKSETKQLSTDEWTKLLRLTVELVGVIDRSLAGHGLDFGAAFRKARTEIADDFPFMNPPAQIFDYEKGRITMTKQINETIFVASISEAVTRIFDRLGESDRFKEAHRDFAHMVIALINKRREQYDRFGLTSPLRRMLGV